MSILFFRRLLCGALGGLDVMEERRMVAYLISRCDVVLGCSECGVGAR